VTTWESLLLYVLHLILCLFLSFARPDLFATNLDRFGPISIFAWKGLLLHFVRERTLNFALAFVSRHDFRVDSSSSSTLD
jgi:hypothetical protein